MPQMINTNISSLNAQRNLNVSQGSLAQALQRLSSGLRINSAKDDAAGLAISDRMTSSIRGLNQAVRNANDGISMAQTAEGAMAEMGNLLQRMRELAIQSANATNSATDRQSLQGEANQLKQELSRIATTTNFNGQKLLEGSLQNAAFQVGSEANQTITFSIKDAQATGLGSHQVMSNNTTSGMAVATRASYVATGGASFGNAAAASTAVADNGNTTVAQTISIKDANGSSVATGTVATGDTAKEIATTLAAINGATASAYNQVTLSNYTHALAGATNAITFKISVRDGTTTTTGTYALAGVDGTSTQAQVFTALQTAINADATTLGPQGVSAVFAANGTDLIIQNNDGQDIAVEVNGTATSVGTFGFDMTGLAGAAITAVTTSVGAGNDTVQASGKVNLFLANGYTASSSLAVGAGTLFTTAAGTAATAVANQGIANVLDTSGDTTNLGNGVAAQTLTVTGESGTANVTVAANYTAAQIVSAVNQYSGTTGVTAEASSKAKLNALSADGTVTFDLYGSNTVAVQVSASVKTTDLTALATSINNKSGSTGITAELGDSNTSITLKDSTGADIQIVNFTHSAAAALSSTSSTGTAVTMAVSGLSDIINSTTGVISTTTTTAVTLTSGGITKGAGQADSTVVGGTVSFKAASSFNVSSSTTGASTSAASSSIFSGIAASSNASTLSSVNMVDISTVTGANNAISVLDGALSQVNTQRSSMGAMQNRFESTIANLQATSENLSAARGRVRDTDFAAETANLTRSQILQQAGIAMLAQANALPNSVMALLR